MFSLLSEKIQATLHKIRGRGKLSPEEVNQFAKELRMQLLAGDVHYRVAQSFSEAVANRALGQNIVASFRPAEIFQKAVYEELVNLLQGEPQSLPLLGEAPHRIFLVGLTGSGKTTTIAKLARWYQSRGFQPLLVSTDVRRPAAREQLKVLGDSLQIPVCATTEEKPKKILSAAEAEAKKIGASILLIDTAGRLHVEDSLMEELRDLISRAKQPHVLYVVDIAAGQDALKAALAFKQALPLSGLILTKLDGDARGGAALSIRQVTDLPIYFVGTGEQTDDFEAFVPERFAGRLLGGGDIATLVEKIQGVVDQQTLEEAGQKFSKGGFTLEDLRQQLRQSKKLGDLSKWASLLPGAGSLSGGDLEAMQKELKRKEAILNSMTPKERLNPRILNGSRRLRIALGSGVAVAQVNRLMKEYEGMRRLMQGGMGKASNLLKRLDDWRKPR